ncbi:type VII secretion system-associated protein [Nocardia amamiensis]|uniref:type VII secretion system-associated protein n=1 Tax=Nocardia amamiensis TaxID=404578 RepID=UPI000AD7A5D2|nr:type VII secretion system-associated protein [Nocardia amamiensis]
MMMNGEIVDATTTGEIRHNDWFVLVDPAWNVTAAITPPTELIVGGWMLNDDGTTQPFRPNPRYRPSAETVPSDPIDAILRRIAAGERDLGEQLVARIHDAVVEIGCDGQRNPLVGTAPDGVDCIVVATAEIQKTGVDADRWVPVHGAELTDIIPTGTDIFLNPSGSAPFRLLSEARKHIS